MFVSVEVSKDLKVCGYSHVATVHDYILSNILAPPSSPWLLPTSCFRCMVVVSRS